MSNTDWHYEGSDERGFAAFDELRQRARRMTRGQFVEAFPVPALLVVHREAETSESSEPSDASDDGVRLLTVSIRSSAVLRYLNRVAFLCKRPGNPYAHLVSIGRSAANDIAIAVDSVSKVHGYFAREGGHWCFTDHGSTNGSLLNDQSVRSGQKNVLRDGDVLQLGLEVSLEYFSPERLYDRAFL